MPKRKSIEDDEDEGGSQSQAALPLKAETADDIAARLCRFVLLREHTRKPVTRTEIKEQVMPEHKAQDRSGKIFKQVLAAANDKLRDIAGLELVDEAQAGVMDDDDADGSGGQSQAAASQSQATQGGGGSGKQASGAARYLLVNRIPDAVVPPLTGDPALGTAIYQAFVEVVLSLIQESEGGVLAEDELFEFLQKLGVNREAKFGELVQHRPLPAEQEKIEYIVQKRLVAEAYLRRCKKKHDADNFEYLPGSRATLSRDEGRAAEFHKSIMIG